MDSYGATFLGFDIKDIQYLPLADKLGIRSMDVSKADIHEYRAELKEHSLFAPSDASNRLGRNVIADSACSVCYGSLIHALQRLQENEKGRCRKNLHRPRVSWSNGKWYRHRKLYS